jgi:putative spermidine/putrescine transport system substrate-binding protein
MSEPFHPADEHEASGVSRRELLRYGAFGAAALVSFPSLTRLLDASSKGPLAAATSSLPTSLGSGGLPALITAAKKEGKINVIALPPNWANYGQIISTFHSKYGLTVNSAAPNDSSAQENTAIQTLKGQSRGPDVVDVSPAIAVSGVADGLYAPYKVATWSTIPASMKEASGLWYGDYYGVISFGTNLSVQKTPPQDWSDLLNARYHAQVAIDGDPRTAGDAFAAVYAAALANGGSLDDIEPGINFFAKLKKSGNFVPADALPANIAKGSTPIAIIWDYLNLANKVQFAGNPSYTVSIPKTGVYGGFYAQGVSKYSPDPMAARLWEEFLYSDQGQLLYLAGFTHPARYADLAARNVIPASLAAKLPPASEYKGIKFASLSQIAAASKVIAAQWGPKVAGS